MIDHIKFIGFLSFTMLFITGCKTLTAPSSSSEIWVPYSSKTADSTWESIRKQKIDTSKPLTLTELIDTALRNNPSTKAAWENARLEEAVKKQKEAKLYPSVTLDAKSTREKTSANMEMADANQLKYGPELQITYLLLDFGGRSADIDEQVNVLLTANYQFNQSIQDLLLNVENSYYGLYSARAALKAAESDLINAKAAYDAAEQRYLAQLAAKLDVLQAKSNYENSLFCLEGAKGALKAAKAELAKTIGLSADAQLEIAEPTKEIPTSIGENDITKLINEAMERRPDIAAQKATVESKKAAIRSANSDLYPTINAGGSASANGYKYFSDAQPRDRDHTYAAYLSFHWDLFDGFENLNKKREAEMEAAVEDAKLIEYELAASAEVWTKYYDFKTALQQVLYADSFLNTSQVSYEMALESYNTGLKSILDLLDAQSKLSDAKSKLIQSKKDLFVSLAELAHSTGSLYAQEIGEKPNEQKR